MDWLNECTSGEALPNGLYRTQIGIAPRAVRLDGYLREIASTWQQGDADLPHLISQAPIRVGIADNGRRRLYPVPGDLSRYIEIGAPLIKPAASWISVGFSGATRTGNRITWSRPQANLSIVHGGHFCKLDIELRGGYVPPNRQFAFPVSLVGLVRQGAQILIQGKTNLGPVMLLRPPVVYDAANPLNTRPITWQFGSIGGQTGVLFTLPDLAGMARPVVDPTLALQPAAAEGVDTYIRSTGTYQSKNFGVATGLLAGKYGSGYGGDDSVSRALIKCGLSSLPSNANLTAVTLSLYLTTDLSNIARTLRVFRQKRAWVEGTQNNAANTTGCEWSDFYDQPNTLSWQTAGGFGADDCEQTDIGSRDFTATETINEFKNITLTPTSKADLDLGNGWLLKMDTETDDAYAFASSDDTTANQRPLLTIVYSLPGGGTGRGRSTLCREARNRWL